MQMHVDTKLFMFFEQTFTIVANRAERRAQLGLPVNPQREPQQDQDPQQRDPEPAGGEGSAGTLIPLVCFYFVGELLNNEKSPSFAFFAYSPFLKTVHVTSPL